jgi:hypothetical protein
MYPRKAYFCIKETEKMKILNIGKKIKPVSVCFNDSLVCRFYVFAVLLERFNYIESF